jgi:hypothetical protein
VKARIEVRFEKEPPSSPSVKIVTHDTHQAVKLNFEEAITLAKMILIRYEPEALK